MKLRPPTAVGRLKNCKRYYGRVYEVVGRTGLMMTIWEWFGDRKGFGRELYSSVALNETGVTHDGKFSWGAPVEIWTWEEEHDGKTIERLHVSGE